MTGVRFLEETINSIEVFSRLTNNSIYIIDMINHKFVYLNAKGFLSTIMPKLVFKGMGLMEYMALIPKEEHSSVSYSFVKYVDFLLKAEINDIPKYSMTMDFHIHSETSMMVNNRLNVITATGNGKPWHLIGTVSLSDRKDFGNTRIYKEGEVGSLTLNHISGSWESSVHEELTIGEIEILFMASQGYTMEETASKLRLTTDGVRSRRKSIFSKLQVNSIIQAICKAGNIFLI